VQTNFELFKYFVKTQILNKYCQFLYKFSILKPIWTHLKQIESLSSTMPWTLACILVLQIMSSALKFIFIFFEFHPIDFPSKTFGAM